MVFFANLSGKKRLLRWLDAWQPFIWRLLVCPSLQFEVRLFRGWLVAVPIRSYFDVQRVSFSLPALPSVPLNFLQLLHAGQLFAHRNACCALITKPDLRTESFATDRFGYEFADSQPLCRLIDPVLALGVSGT